MYRWLLSGRMETKTGPRRPIDVLSDPVEVAAALAEIRDARKLLRAERAAKAGSKAPQTDGDAGPSNLFDEGPT